MQLEDVSFEGYVPPEALPGYYQRADVFCSPSTINEAFGITLIEAMAAGTPTVVTSINSATIGEDGTTGLVVRPKEPQALAEAVLRLLEDRGYAERLAEAARDRALLFDWHKVADQLLEYYRESSVLAFKARPAKDGYADYS
jgi:phosphatidylinositol alpha-mannosyltransferase